MTVRGNPNLISKYADITTRGGIAKHQQFISSQTITNAISSSEIKTFYDRYIKKDLNNFRSSYYDSYVVPKFNKPEQQDISAGPVFAKINIKGPMSDWTNFMNESGVDQTYTGDFFYNGLYRLVVVNTTFSNGQFSHELHMIPRTEDT